VANLARSNAWTAPFIPKQPKAQSQRRRTRLFPRAESLELRTCLSTLTPATAIDGPDESSTPSASVAHHDASVESTGHAGSHAATVAAKKAAARPSVVFIKSGRSAALKSAINNASPGTTIYVAPGIYRQNFIINRKSNFTIVGAADQSTIFAPAKGDALRVQVSSNITVENIWFRSTGSQGRGVIDAGSSLTLDNVRTDGTHGDGVLAISSGRSNAYLTANDSQFDTSQTGDGVDLRPTSVATITGCTINGNGTSPSATLSSVGLAVGQNSQVTLIDTQLNGNTNSGLVALLNAQVTAQGCTFSFNQKGDGALFLNQSTANLSGNTFASNGRIVGEGPGFNGVEFSDGFSGSGLISGNTFLNNTANGVWVGSAPNQIQILGNVFEGNVFGVSLDASAGPVSAVVQGNTFSPPPGLPQSGGATIYYCGLVAFGTNATATVGGAGAAGNTFENYPTDDSIVEDNVSDGVAVGYPSLTILANQYLSNGVAVSASNSITYPPA
jgi:nitrous oxidase accessory protein NosD